MKTYIITARKGTQQVVVEVEATAAKSAEKKFLRTHSGYDEIRTQQK